MLTNLIDETFGAFPRVAQIGVDFSGPDCLLGAVLLKKKIGHNVDMFPKETVWVSTAELKPK